MSGKTPLWVWVLSLGLLLPSCEASPYGAVVNIETLNDPGVGEVRAYYTAIAPLPCPSLLDNVCSDASSNCAVYTTSTPLQGQMPSPGWCVRQWQQSIPSIYTSSLTLGTSVNITLNTKVDLSVRVDTKKVNQPPFTALPPPIWVSVECPHSVALTVKDLDQDTVKCRYAREDLGECQGDCPQQLFLRLEEDSCTLSYAGGAAVGQYHVKIMVEDYAVPFLAGMPVPEGALSSSPVYLSITVENGSADCPAPPQFAQQNPAEGDVASVLPYEQLTFNISFLSEGQSISEIAIVGPPELYVSPMMSQPDSQTTVQVSWVRSPNQLSHLLPICFTANSISSQSDKRCIWLQQKKMNIMPIGTEVTCGDNRMSLVLPIASLINLPLNDLKLNDGSCPVSSNSTHITVSFLLTECGTNRVQSGSEMVYTNILQSRRPTTMISRVPSLILPLACRIPGQTAKGPEYNISIPSETQTFGDFAFRIELYPPGQGPKIKSTDMLQKEMTAAGMVRAAQRLDELDLYVFSNTTVDKAELKVDSCVESATADFAVTFPLLNQGCMNGNTTIEMLSSNSKVKIFKINLENLNIEGTTMYVQCMVHLCIATMPNQTCPSSCGKAAAGLLVNSIVTKDYLVRSGPVLIINTPQTSTQATTTPTTTTTERPTTTLPTTVTQSSASERFSTLTLGVTAGVVHMFLQ